MSWYRDPQLFIYGNLNGQFYVNRCRKEFGHIPLSNNDLEEQGTKLEFSKHLSLGNNKETDYDAFKASFPVSGAYYKVINSQGFVIHWENNIGTSWSIEEPNSPFWSLPGITKQKSVTEQALEDKVSDLESKNSSLQDEINSKNVEKEAQDKRVISLEAEISSLKDVVNTNKVEKEAMDKRVSDLEAENSFLKAEVHRARDEKILAGLEILEIQVSDLTSKLVQCCGAAGGGSSSVEEPWISVQPVPSNWVSFDDLDVKAFSKNIPLTVTKGRVGPELGDNNTTNVKPNCFYRGLMFPLVVVDVAELTPNREEARFDPDIWGLYDIGGVSYAARKPFASEMSVDAHKTC